MITTKQTITLIERLLKFPYPQICRHSVALDLLSCLEENGKPMPTELVKAVCRAEDKEALDILNQVKLESTE